MEDETNAATSRLSSDLFVEELRNTHLDIVIPVFNEGENIISVLESLRENVKSKFRVLICYDFDEDNTLTALENYNASFEIVYVKNSGRGPHRAVTTGFKASRAPYVIVYPADDDYNAGILDAMVLKAKTGCDIVAASRFMEGGAMCGCPWLKASIVRLSAMVLHNIARVPTHDPSNGFRLFSRRAVDSIVIESEEGFTYSIELLVKCHRLGWQIGEVPAQWFERTCGTSRFRVLKWLPSYFRWFAYAFATTYFFKGPAGVALHMNRLEENTPEEANVILSSTA